MLPNCQNSATILDQQSWENIRNFRIRIETGSCRFLVLVSKWLTIPQMYQKSPAVSLKKNDNNIYSFKQRVLKITNFVRFNWTELFWYIVIHEWIYDLMTFGNIQSVGGYFGSYWFFHFRSSSFLPRTWNCKWRTKGAYICWLIIEILPSFKLQIKR